MNVGQNGDPDDRVRLGHLWRLNGGEAVQILQAFYRSLNTHYAEPNDVLFYDPRVCKWTGGG